MSGRNSLKSSKYSKMSLFIDVKSREKEFLNHYYSSFFRRGFDCDVYVIYSNVGLRMPCMIIFQNSYLNTFPYLIRI